MSSGAGEHREHVRDAAQFPELSAAAEHGKKSFVGTTPFPPEQVPGNREEVPANGMADTKCVAVLERHQDLVDELLAEVEGYKPDADRELLTRAFDFAARAHDGQVRRSGQEFIYHPWGAAKILAGLRLDEPTLAAALLHDTVEDTGIEIETSAPSSARRSPSSSRASRS